ncbi:MAG: glycerol-3-phosphate 1-O-acyltransferase PlsY [candidate division Zixibacteria bacterium]|nr:glycerol-3-phosphate 1-O-acyltransferase PlsY [candidate division Zixibacteria bacterium]
MLTLLPITASYLLGAIPFGLLVPRLFGVADIRAHGSGNIGATNVGRIVGYKAAVWVYIGDVSKGLAAVFLARQFLGHYEVELVSGDAFLLICVLAAVLGHVFPVYLGFKGGKGVNTALGGMLALLPFETLLSLAVFGIVVVITKYVSLSSMAAALSFFLIVTAEKYLLGRDIVAVYVWMAGIVVLLIFITHRQNIVRLIAGTESKITRSVRSREAHSDG